MVEREQGAEARYRLLETVRQYAREKLAESGEGSQARAQHLNYFLQFAEEAEPHLFRAEQLEWLARLETEHDNLRAALEWALNSEEQNPPEAGLRLANALGWFWKIRGYEQEGREWFGRALATPDPARTVARARALGYAGVLQDDRKQELKLCNESLALSRELGYKPGMAFALVRKGALAYNSGDYSTTKPSYEESLNLYRELGDKWGIAWALYALGQYAHLKEYDFPAARQYCEESLKLSREIGDRRRITWTLSNLGHMAAHQGDLPTARAFFEECLSLSRELGDKSSVALWLIQLGYFVATGQGDYEWAVKLLEESLSIGQALGDRWRIASALFHLGVAARYQGEYEQAVKLLQEGLAIDREIDRMFIAETLCFLGAVARLQGDYASARAFYTEAVPISRDIDDRETIAYLIAEFAALSTAQGEAKRAAILFGAEEALREAIHVVPVPVERAEIDRNIAAARAQLDEAAFNAAWEEGRGMTMEEAIEYALEV